MASTTITANGAGSWIKLPLPRGNTVNVDCATWSTSSVALEYSKDGTDVNKKPLPSPIDGSPLVVTSNYPIEINAAGYIRGVMSTYGGTAVTIQADG